jgi:hypothetical protein
MTEITEDECTEILMAGSAKKILRRKDNVLKNYPQGVREAAREVVRVLELHYPGISELNYSEDSLASCEGSNLENRMIFGIYMELLRAGKLK